MPSHITLDRLIAHDACARQVALFRKHFPDGSALVTPAACAALAPVFDWDWAAAHLLASAPARAQYDAARSTAQAQYDAAATPAQAQYDAAATPAQAQYAAARSTARAQYNAAVTPARAQYGATIAVAFADAYLSQP